jgi:drug/metabolite transporter (DMT)-like permease
VGPPRGPYAAPVAALLALLSSVLWGSSDFFGGLASRRLPAVLVVGWSQGAGLVGVTAVAVLRGATDDPSGWLVWSVLAGVCGAVGLVAFYTALAIGTMGVVSPIAALGVVVPVVVGLLGGDRPSTLQAGGMVLGLLGALAASGPELSGRGLFRARARSVRTELETGSRGRTLLPEPDRAAAPARSVWLACAAGLAFGVALLGIQRGADHSPLMTLVGMRASSVGTFAAGALLLRRTVGVPARMLPLLIAVGLVDAGANLAFAFATVRGLPSVVAVIGALYPVATVLLGRFVLGERLAPVQQLGVGLAMGGVALLAAG